MDIPELDELQKKYYYMFNDLKDAKPALSENAYNYMGGQIFAQYKTEAELLRLRLTIDSEKKKYGLLYQQSRLIPRMQGHFFWKKPNTAALLLENELEREIQREFDERAKELWGDEDEETPEEEYYEGSQEEEVPITDYAEGEYYEEEQERLEEPTDLLIEGKGS